MSNSYWIPIKIELKIRLRDKKCVYCNKIMLLKYKHSDHCNSPTIEHLSENPPFYWKEWLKEENVTICCGSCNSSRWVKKINEWFNTKYCINNNINENTVSTVVKSYLYKL